MLQLNMEFTMSKAIYPGFFIYFFAHFCWFRHKNILLVDYMQVILCMCQPLSLTEQKNVVLCTVFLKNHSIYKSVATRNNDSVILNPLCGL